MKRIITSALLAVATVATVAGTVHAQPLSAGEHGCTYTNPEYIVSDVNADVHFTPGTVQFTATHRHVPGRSNWNDTYLITGYNRGSNAVVLCGHYGRDYAYRLPFSATAPVRIRSSLSYTAHGQSANMIGWDLWLVRNGEEASETTSWGMQSDHRTVEIMVIPGRYGHIFTVNGRWHRVYIGGGSMQNVDLQYLMRVAMRASRVNPANYQWQVIGAGAEFTRGTFSVRNYNLSITTSVRATRHATATATYTARNGKYTATATRRVTVTVRKTVTLPVKGQPLNVQRYRAYQEAAARAQATATARARTVALRAAWTAANEILLGKVHPRRVLPKVVHARLGAAISVLQHNAFLNLRWTRGLKTTAVVTWEAGHPGHLTPVKARIILRAKRA